MLPGECVTYIHEPSALHSSRISPAIPDRNSSYLQGPGIDPKAIDWKAKPEMVDHWPMEWNVLLDAIRNDRPHNEARRAASPTWQLSWAERPCIPAKPLLGTRSWHRLSSFVQTLTVLP